MRKEILQVVYLREGESLDELLKRFNKMVDKESILSDFRKHEYFVKPSLRQHEFKRKKIRENLRNRRSKVHL